MLAALSAAQTVSGETTPEKLRQNQEILSRDAKWTEDIDAFADGLRRTHPNPFHSMSDRDFDQAIARVKEEVPKLNDPELMVRLMRIAGSVAARQDGHSAVVPYLASPVRAYLFPDGLFIVGAPAEYREFIGSRILKIGGTDVKTVERRVAPLVTRDNRMTAISRLPPFMMCPDLLRGIGLWEGSEDSLPLLVEREGETSELRVTPERMKLQLKGFHLPPLAKENPRWLKEPLDKEHVYRRKRAFFFDVLRQNNALYIQYNAVRAANPDGQTLAEFSRELLQAIDERKPKKVIVDVRHNTGGSNKTYVPLLEALTKSPQLHTHGVLYLLTSRVTFSAAGNFVTELEKKTRVILVGEPSGGSPNQYGDSRMIPMKYTELFFVVWSSKYHEKGEPDEERLVHEVDIPVSMSSSDYFSGSDPVLAAALKDNGAPLVREDPNPRPVLDGDARASFKPAFEN